ncbi:MAG: hypothetical protein WC992_03860 [Acholeplasmataceae bacterium]
MRDGGPAFPTTIVNLVYGDEGMSLRDWFAGCALSHICMHGALSPEHAAKASFSIADAMLTERKRRNAPPPG